MKGRDLAATGLAGLCILPSAVCNVAPHIIHATADSGAASMAAFQGVSVITMAVMPFAIKNLAVPILKAGCYLLSIVLLCLNFLNALDVASSVRETATGGNRGTIQKFAGLNSRLEDLRKSRAQVPPFTFTSPASVSAAQSAVRAAETARENECRKVGDLCRKRMDEATAALAALSRATEQAGLSERSEKLDGEIVDLEKQISALGPVPVHADDTASKVTRIIGLFGRVTDNDVSEWRPIAFAVGIELLAFIGPIGMFAALGGSVPRETKPAKVEPAKKEAPAPIPAGVEQSPATPAKVKKAKRINKSSPAGVGDVREWFNSRVAARAGCLIRCNEVYSAYVEWSKAAGLEAVSLTKFGTDMKRDLGVEYIEKSKRGFYAGIALKGAALKVVKA